MRSAIVLLAFLAASCARPNLRPEWIRTAGSAYGCPPEMFARADTGTGFWGQDPRTLEVGTSVCELIARTAIPNRILPDRRVVGAVRETWLYALPTDAAGAHTEVLTLEGMTRREMVISARQEVTIPAPARPQAAPARRGRG
jgi:hypothetical protein